MVTQDTLFFDISLGPSFDSISVLYFVNNICYLNACEREKGEGGRERFLEDLIIYLGVSVLKGKIIASFIIS